MEQKDSSQKKEKPSIFETIKDSMKEEDKAINRRTETKNHSTLIRSLHNTTSFK